MKERSVVLIRGQHPAPDETKTIESLRARGALVRFVTIPAYWSSYDLEPCDIAYSMHKELIEPYKKGVLIKENTPAPQVAAKQVAAPNDLPPTRMGSRESATNGADTGATGDSVALGNSPLSTPLPRGFYVKKTGPYYRLINTATGEQVNPKALHKKPMEQFILSMGGK